MVNFHDCLSVGCHFSPNDCGAYPLFSPRPQTKKHKWSSGRGIELVILLSKMSLKHFTDLSKISKASLNSAQPGLSSSLIYKRLEVASSDRFWLGVQVYLRSTMKHHPEIPSASSLLPPRMSGGQAYISQQESRTSSLEKFSHPPSPSPCSPQKKSLGPHQVTFTS